MPVSRTQEPHVANGYYIGKCISKSLWQFMKMKRRREDSKTDYLKFGLFWKIMADWGIERTIDRPFAEDPLQWVPLFWCLHGCHRRRRKTWGWGSPEAKFPNGQEVCHCGNWAGEVWWVQSVRWKTVRGAAWWLWPLLGPWGPRASKIDFIESRD